MGGWSLLWVWGAAGALIFAAPTLVLALWAAPKPTLEEGRRSRVLAIANFVIALFTGCIFAQAFTATLSPWINRWVKMDPVAVALTIGWASNYLWPIILRRLGALVETKAIPPAGGETP